MAQRTPFVFGNPYRDGSLALAVSSLHHVFLCVEYQIGMGRVESFMADETHFESKRYTTTAEDPTAFALALKTKAVERGATPEAIRFLGTVVPLSKKEVATMATAKLSKGNAAELKNAAKGAPVKGKPAPAAKAAPATKGNAEALAKARAAKGPPVNRKYKVVVKAKDIKAREGTWTRAMVDHIVGHTNTDEATAALKADKAYSDRRLDFKWAEDKGYIAF